MRLTRAGDWCTAWPRLPAEVCASVHNPHVSFNNEPGELPLEPDTRLVFRAGVFSARVGRTASGRYTLLDAVIAGRLDANDVVDSIFRREFTFGGVKNELCTFSSGDAVLFQNFVVETVCAERDITVAEITTADGGVLCDGLSAAAPLDFFPARLGPSKASSPSTVCGEIPRCPR